MTLWHHVSIYISVVRACLSSERIARNLEERAKAESSCLQDLWHWWRRQFSAKDLVPESAGHAKAVLVVHEVVLQVVLLEVAVVGRKAVMEISTCYTRW